jgi:hypothetical protein
MRYSSSTQKNPEGAKAGAGSFAAHPVGLPSSGDGFPPAPHEPQPRRPMPEILAWYDDRSDEISNFASRRNAALLSTVAAIESGTTNPPFAPTVPVPPEPSASTTPSTVELTARVTMQSKASLGLSVNQASQGATPTDIAATVERRLSEHPTEIREAARALSKAIADQIAELISGALTVTQDDQTLAAAGAVVVVGTLVVTQADQTLGATGAASKPNEPDRLAQHNDFVAFLQTIAAGLDALAESIDQAIAGGSAAKPEPILLGKAGEIARQLSADCRHGLERNRIYIVDCSIKVCVFAAGFTFLHTIGVDGYVAGVVAALMNVKVSKGDDSKK